MGLFNVIVSEQNGSIFKNSYTVLSALTLRQTLKNVTLRQISEFSSVFRSEFSKIFSKINAPGTVKNRLDKKLDFFLQI